MSIPGKPRRPSLRLRGWDYSIGTLYAVTICVRGRNPVLSAIVDARVELLPAGLVVAQSIESLPVRFARVTVLEAVVMPDHVHLLLDLEDDDGPSLSTVIGAFKSETSRSINRSLSRKGPFWQRGFHDRIVRNWTEAENLAAYMRDNPRRWSESRR